MKLGRRPIWLMHFAALGFTVTEHIGTYQKGGLDSRDAPNAAEIWLPATESYLLIYNIGWIVYRQMAEPPLLIASAFTRDPHRRLKLATDLFRSFPFGAPSYEWREVLS